MRHILLLRGINVGGKNKVSMSDLEQLLLNAGFEDVASYINSGNVFFSSTQNRESFIPKITHLLKTGYDFSIPFALISKEEYLEERAALPEWWNEKLARRDVLFFSLGLDKSEVFDFIAKAAFYNEIVHVGSHALFLGKYYE